MTTFEEWMDREAEAEVANIALATKPDGARHPWIFPLDADYSDDGREIYLVRHRDERVGDLDYEALGRLTVGAPLPQSAIVYMAVDGAVEPGTYQLSTRSATCDLNVAVAAGTGRVLRVLIHKGAVVEYSPIRQDEIPAEEVLLPQGELEIYDGPGFACKGATVVDAELFES